MTPPRDIASLPFDRQVLASWIEQAVASDDFKGIANPAGKFVDLPALQALRDHLQDPTPLVAEQQAMAAFLWSYFSAQDGYQQVALTASRPAERTVPTLWTSIDPAANGLLTIEDEQLVIDELSSTLRVTGPVESLIEFNEQELGTQLRRLLRKALNRASQDPEHSWGLVKINRFSRDHLDKLKPWESSPEFRDQAIELLRMTYLSSRSLKTHEANRDTMFAYQIIEWLESFPNPSRSQPLANLAVAATPQDFMCQMPTQSPPVLGDRELLQIEELIEDLNLIRESTTNPQVEALFVELDTWWQENTEISKSALPPRLGEAIAFVLDWKTSSLLVNPDQEVHSDKIDFQVLSEAADILRIRQGVSQSSIFATLRQWGDLTLTGPLNFYLTELENFQATRPNQQQWIEWIGRYPDLTAMVLVISGQAQHPQAEGILRIINPEIPAWTLYVLSRVQHSAFGIEVWAAELAVRHHPELFVAPHRLDDPRQRQRRAHQLLQDPTLSAAFEAAGISSSEALFRFDKVIEELGNWPSPTDEIFQRLPFGGLQTGEPEQLGNLMAIIDLQHNLNFLLLKSELTSAQWKELKSAFKERHQPNRWTDQHNQQLARVLENVKKYCPDLAQGDLAEFLQKVLRYLQAESNALPQDLRQKAGDADNRIRQAFLREIEVVQKVKILRLQTAWTAYSRLKGDAVKPAIKQTTARQFIFSLQELYMARMEGSDFSDFKKWLFNTAEQQEFIMELQEVLAEPSIEAETIHHALRLSTVQPSVDNAGRSGIVETSTTNILAYDTARESEYGRKGRLLRLERVRAGARESENESARTEHLKVRARVRGRQIIEARKPVEMR